MASRTKKAMYNTAVMMAYQITTTVCGLILPRLILQNYGSAYNGTISSITRFISFISILRLGVAGATRVELYRSLAKKDIEKTSGIINATELYMRQIAYVLLGYIVILTCVFPWLVDGSLNKWGVAALVLIIGAGTFAEYFFGITYNTLLTADQHAYVYFIIHGIATVLNTAIGALLISFGASIYIVKLGSAILFFLCPVVLSLYVKKRYKLIKDIKPDKSALSQKNDVMAQSIANIVHSNVDVTVLTLFTSVQVVSVYSVYNLVIASITKMMNIFTTGFEAAFGNMFAKQEYANIERNLCVYEFFIAAYISIVFSCTYVLMLPFVSLYTKGVTDIEYILPTFALLTLIAESLQCFREPYRTIVQAAGKYKETRNGAIIEALINLVISVIAVFQFGIIGVTLGTIAANLFRTVQYVCFVSSNLLKRSVIRTIGNAVWILVNIIIVSELNHIIPIVFEYNSWFDWVKSALVVATLSGLVTLLMSLIFYRKQINRLFNILANRRRSKITT